MRLEFNGEAVLNLVVPRPGLEPLFEKLDRNLRLNQVLELGRTLAHGFRGCGSSGTCNKCSVHAGSPDMGLRSLVGRIYESQPSLHARQGEHAVFHERGCELFGGHAVDLVASVGYEIEHEAELSYLLGEFLHFLVGHSRRVPVKGRGEVVGKHLVRKDLVNGVCELPCVLKVCRFGFHPEQVGEGCHGKRLCDCVFDSAFYLGISLRRS